MLCLCHFYQAVKSIAPKCLVDCLICQECCYKPICINTEFEIAWSSISIASVYLHVLEHMVALVVKVIFSYELE